MLRYPANLSNAKIVGEPLVFGGGAGAPVLSYSWQDMGQDAVIAAKVTPADNIRQVKWWDDRVWAAHGNINGTPRPLGARYFDPADGLFYAAGATISADGLYIVKPLDNQLWMLNSDPASVAPWCDYILLSAWNSVDITGNEIESPQDATHSFDIVKHTNNKYYIAGHDITGADAVVWESSDKVNWTQVYTNSSFDWCTFIFSYNGYLWVQPTNASGSPNAATAWRSADGTSWADSGIDLFPATSVSYGGMAYPFDGKLFYHTESNLSANAGSIFMFDGTTVTRVNFPLNMGGICVDSGYLYCWGSFLYRTDVATAVWTNWTQVSDPPSATNGLDVVDGLIWAGADDGHVYKGTPNISESRPFLYDAHGSGVLSSDGRSVQST